MQSRWNTVEAPTDPLEQCAYGSRLLGSDDLLVLHGGGNTSVKTTAVDVTGAEIEVLHVKGSGYDLATIPPEGFVPLRISRLRELLQLERMSDPQMVNELRCARSDASAPGSRRSRRCCTPCCRSPPSSTATPTPSSR